MPIPLQPVTHSWLTSLAVRRNYITENGLAAESMSTGSHRGYVGACRIAYQFGMSGKCRP
jgi:hypothetical protein